MSHSSRNPAPAGFVKSSTLAKSCGMSMRKLDYYIRSGWIHPTVDAQGSGEARLFSDEDARRCEMVLNRYAQLVADLDRFKDRAACGHEWDDTEGA